MPEINQAWLALIGALLGGSGLKFVEYLLNRSKSKEDAATQMRAELRDEIRGLREELRKVEDELDKWRAKYYELMDEFMSAKVDLAEALRGVRDSQS
jgi:predicted  nucleic acid-binding Zn-ribbon protein